LHQVSTNPPVSVPMHAGYYVVGKQKNAAGDGYRAWIARVNLAGALDTTFGTDGWIFGNTQDAIVDAQIVGGKAYVLGNIFAGTAAQPIVRVACYDLTTPTGSNCFAGFGGTLAFDTSSTGPRTAAYGQKLAYDSRFGLFVAARIMNTNRGQEVGIARISADTGALITDFGGTGYNIGLPSWAGEPNAVVSVNALAVTPEGYPGGTRLYVGGQISRSTTDHDGFVLGLGPSTGATQSGWNWNVQEVWYEEDDPTFRKDAVTALTIQRNGQIVLAGWSETGDPDVSPMFLKRLNSDGSRDTSLCFGNPNRNVNGTCLVDPPYGSTFGTYKPKSVPVAVLERRQNRDLVVVQRFENHGFFLGTSDDGHVRTLVQQFSASGNRLHASRSIDFPGYPSANWSRPFAAWMGGTGLWNASENSGYGEEVLAIVGTRLYDGVDYDAAVLHLKSTDSIFADQFGGEHGD
ncbi:MAG TPA: delta-60 repeat domain-containing protein, partial [Rhodanobacteraceae bacterium]|nr:delta-60 repeat domain-containing protein [Rhodanobacteraceae bacterium]